MPLDFKVVPIAFTQGQDTRTQPKLVLPGKWQSLQNYSLSKDNTPRRRDGSQVVVSSATGNGLATRVDELLVIDGPGAKSYAPSRSALKAVTGELGYVSVARTDLVLPHSGKDSMDSATSGTVTLHVWRDFDITSGAFPPRGISCSLVDQTTGTILLNATQLRSDSLAINPRVVYDSNGAFYVFYESSTGANKLYCRVVTTAGVVGAEATLINDANLPITNFDACYFPQNGVPNGVLVVYRWNDGVTSTRAIQVTRAGTVPSIAGAALDLTTAAALPTATIRGLAVATFVGGTAGVFILQTTAPQGITAVTITTNFVVGAGPTIIYAFAQVAAESHIAATRNALGVGGDYLQVFSDQRGAYSSVDGVTPISTVTVSASLSIISSGASIGSSAAFAGAGNPRGPQGPWIYGKPFTTSAGRVVLPCHVIESYANLVPGGATVNQNTQNTIFLLDGATGVVVGKALYGALGVTSLILTPTVSTPCSISAVSSTQFVMPVPKFGQLLLVNGQNTSPIGLSVLSFSPRESLPMPHVEIGQTTVFAGGVLSSYDGGGIVEHGFNLFPEGVTVAAVAGGGATAGVHQVVVVYEWTDSMGRVHQSSPSPACTVTTTGPNATIRVRAPTLLLTLKSGVLLVPYITTVNGTIFYRATGTNPNDTTINYLTFNFGDSDATLSANQELYSQPDQAGTTLPNDAPPPCTAVAVSQNRLWLLNADSPLEFRYSQELLNGIGLQFNGLFGDDTLGGLVPSESGGTVAIAPLDEKTIIFCASKPYVVFGNGPTSNGQNNQLSDPEEIPSAVGCSDVLSVLRIPQGLMFKSQVGWHLLGRDLSVEYIGEGVSAYDSYTIVSATLMKDRQECRFEAQTSSGGADGVTLVFSYLLGQWSVFTRGTNASHPLAARDALWFQPLREYMWLAPSTGTVQQNGLFADVPGLWDDFIGTANQAVVICGGVTAWFRPTVLNGFERIRRLYVTMSPANATQLNTSLRIIVDFDDIPNQLAPGAYTVSGIILTATSGANDLRHKLHRQKCKSVQFTFIEQPSTLLQLPLLGLQSLAMEIGFKKGVNKLPSGQTV